jgi:hypothetical protein
MRHHVAAKLMQSRKSHGEARRRRILPNASYGASWRRRVNLRIRYNAIQYEIEVVLFPVSSRLIPNFSFSPDAYPYHLTKTEMAQFRIML